MAFNFNNPIAYVKRGMSTDVDACNLVGVAGVTAYNGMLVTLGAMNATPNAEGKGYVFNATPTTANTDVDVWMVRSPEVPMDVPNNIFIDPRAFSIEAGRPFDLVRPMPSTDFIHVSDAAFGNNQKPDSTHTYVVAAANGQYIAQAAGTGVSGVVFKYVGTEVIPVGQEMVTGYILRCIQNPNPALA